MHKSVLVTESVKALHIKNQGHYIDATLGAGGHTIEILKHGGNVIGLDADEKMLRVAKEKIVKACPTLKENLESRLILLPGNFSRIDAHLLSTDVDQIDGIIADLGISMYHYKDDNRGFSFINREDLLDMRLDPENQAVKASDLLNSLSERQLVHLFCLGMNEVEAKRIARGVVNSRDEHPIVYVSDFLEICEGVIRKNKIHPATQAFMALRMAVNNELDNLNDLIEKSVKILASGGRLVIITFHSKEDYLVSRLFKSLKKDGVVRIAPEDGILPSANEVSRNPSARSAKLRVIEKI